MYVIFVEIVPKMPYLYTCSLHILHSVLHSKEGTAILHMTYISSKDSTVSCLANMPTVLNSTYYPWLWVKSSSIINHLPVKCSLHPLFWSLECSHVYESTVSCFLNVLFLVPASMDKCSSLGLSYNSYYWWIQCNVFLTSILTAELLHLKYNEIIWKSGS